MISWPPLVGSSDGGGGAGVALELGSLVGFGSGLPPVSPPQATMKTSVKTIINARSVAKTSSFFCFSSLKFYIYERILAVHLNTL